MKGQFQFYLAQVSFILCLIFFNPLWTLSSWAHPCSHCFKEHAELKVCGGCRSTNYCSKECQTSAWPAHKSTCSTLKPYKELSGQVAILPSTLPKSGRGLFARHPIKKGSAIAVYHGEIFEEDAAHHIKHGPSSYLQGLNENKMIDGEKNPIAPHLAAQIANDPFISAEEIETLTTINCSGISAEYEAFVRALTVKYDDQFIHDFLLDTDHARANSELTHLEGDSFPILAAIRDIAKDEEIFYHYGLKYWMLIPTHLCDRKGAPEIGLTLRRIVSSTREEQVKTQPQYQFLLDHDPYFMTESTYRKNLEIFSKYPIFRYSWMIQFKSVNILNPDTNESLAKLSEFPGLEARLAEIGAIPHSEFMTETAWGKVHPKTIALFLEWIDFLNTFDLGKTETFQHQKSKTSLSWNDLRTILITLE